MVIREKYLSIESFDEEIYELIHELNQSGISNRKWDGILNYSALIVTDFQNYFLDPHSHAFIPAGPVIQENISQLVDFFRLNNRPVIFTKHINNEEDAQSMKYWWKDLISPVGSMSELYGRLHSKSDIIIEKHQYDAYHGTDLEEILRNNDVVYPVICGVMANLCCETTLRSAFVKGLRPVMPVDATAAYNRQFHLATFRNITFGFSPLLTTDEVIKCLNN